MLPSTTLILATLLPLFSCATPPTPASPAVSVSAPATAPSTRPVDEPTIERITIAGEEFKLEVSADDVSRTKGFMGRTEIARDGGMLFIHPEPAVQGYWMKNCLTDMDILYLNDEGRITAAHDMKIEPPRRERESEFEYESRLKRYSSHRAARFAIELQAGSIQRLKLKVGMTIDAEWARLRNLAE